MEQIKNLAQLKRRLGVGSEFEIIKHWKETLNGQVRQIKEANTQGIYTVLRDFPESDISLANNGRGSYLGWGKTSYWSFEKGHCTRYTNEEHRNETFVLSFRIIEKESSDT